MIYDQRHTRLIANWRAVKQMPMFSVLLVVRFPHQPAGLNGFVGEFLIMLAFGVTPRWTAVAATGVILGAITCSGCIAG
jgi:NADH:ubiquinone oxidoreductase subunit 4 (subunit M)